MNLKKIIREIPDYPKEGINFKDVTTLFKDNKALEYVLNKIVTEFKGKGITKVLGLEARGFILGGALAERLGAGFVPVRKEGKLPSDKMSMEYDLEYGTDCIEIHIDALDENDVVLIHDDLLATGGTAFAALDLIRKMGIKHIYFSFICDLGFIGNPKKDVIKSYENQILVNY